MRGAATAGLTRRHGPHDRSAVRHPAMAQGGGYGAATSTTCRNAMSPFCTVKLLFAICTMTTSSLTLVRKNKPMVPSANLHVATFVTPDNDMNCKRDTEASNNGQGNQDPSAAGSVMFLSSGRISSSVSQAWNL